MACDELAIGLMSGTSADGIDVALISVNTAGTPTTKLWAQTFRPYQADERQILMKAAQLGALAVDVKQADMQLGFWMADAVRQLIRESGAEIENIRVIGSHGHTVAHYPEQGISWQIGNPHVLAEMTGVAVVSDFRQRDVILGGQGAPLVPYYDYVMFHDPREYRVLLNLGGISNLTVLAPHGDLHSVRAWDSGPANMILDGLVEISTHSSLIMDGGGALMHKGHVHQPLLQRWLQHPYFAKPSPKSTGREQFGSQYTQQIWREAIEEGLSLEDMLATAGEMIAVSIGQAVRQATSESVALIAAGGGTHNGELMRRISGHLQLLRPWQTTRDYGVPEDIKEAMAFAYFGWAYVNQIAINLPGVTGASRPAVMGSYVPAGERGHV